MSISKFFSAIISVLFTPRRFWQSVSLTAESEQSDVLKDYAVPVIALVQLLKFPLIGVPRMAMFFSIAVFLVDCAAMYLLLGGVSSFSELSDKKESTGAIMRVLCHAMTPVWLVELLYFIHGWNLLFAFVAVAYALMLVRIGFSVMFKDDPERSAGLFRSTALLFTGVNMASFLVIMALVRLFNF